MSSNQQIPILNRTLRVLEAVTERGHASAKQLSIDLDIPSATCYRILNTLADAHWLRRDKIGDYRLSFGISRLGGVAADMARFFGIVHTPLRELSELTGCSVKISVREGDDWLMLARHEHPKAHEKPLAVGSRDCVVVGSVGAVLMRQAPDAEIQQIIDEHPQLAAPEGISERIAYCRENGHAHDFGVTSAHVHAVSIPLDVTPMEENAAITLSAQPGILPKGELQAAIARLSSTAVRIQEALAS